MYPVQLYQYILLFMRYAYTLICEYVEIFKSLKKKKSYTHNHDNSDVTLYEVIFFFYMYNKIFSIIFNYDSCKTFHLLIYVLLKILINIFYTENLWYFLVFLKRGILMTYRRNVIFEWKWLSDRGRWSNLV